MRVRDKIKKDVEVWADVWEAVLGRPAGLVFCVRLFLLEPGFQLALLVRLQEAANRLPIGSRLVRRLVWRHAVSAFGCHIDPDAVIGPGVYFPHPIGIVIGGHCRLGAGVIVLQHVTVGRVSPGVPAGPVIEDGAILSAGAVVIGAVTIGKNAVVGANAVVRIDVPEGRSAVGVPARLLPMREFEPNQTSDEAVVAH